MDQNPYKGIDHETQYLIYKERTKGGRCLQRSLLVAVIIVFFSFVGYSCLLFSDQFRTSSDNKCSDTCNIQLVESIPEGLMFNSSIKSLRTHDAWSWLIEAAENSIENAALYWSLRGEDIWEDESDWAGEDIFKKLASGD